MPSTDIYPLSLHDALPICNVEDAEGLGVRGQRISDALEQGVEPLEHGPIRLEEHTSELQSLRHLVCRLPTSTLFPYTTLFRSATSRMRRGSACAGSEYLTLSSKASSHWSTGR